ncbi:Meiotic recombination protein dmc1 [Agyrium rufum]|nr:Meiotic recombination protein dmc1 [Agyrium rufum]
MPASTIADDLEDEVGWEKCLTLGNGQQSANHRYLRPQEFIVDIDGIQAHGVGAADITKLKANGYYTVASVHAATRRTLLKIKGFSEVKVEKIKEAIAKCQPTGGGFMTAMELGHQRKRVVRISTGSKQLDTILNG